MADDGDQSGFALSVILPMSSVADFLLELRLTGCDLVVFGLKSLSS